MYTFDQRIAERGPAKFSPRTDLRTGMGLATKDAVFRTWTAGKFHSMSELRERNADLMKMAHDGFFPEEVLDKAVPPVQLGMSLDDGLEDEADFEYLTQYANDHGHQFLTEEQIEERVKQETKDRYEQKLDAYEDAPTGVRAAMNVTDIAMAMLDPVYAPTYVMGLPMMARSFQGIKGTLAARAAGTATLEGGIESVAQVHAYKWNNEVGINYSVERALLNIGVATGVAGVLTLGADALAIKLRQFIDKGRKAGADPTEIAQAEKVVDYLKGHGDDTKAIDVLRETQRVAGRGASDFTAGPAVPDALSLKMYPGREARAMPSGQTFEGTPSTWQIRLGETKKPAKAAASTAVEKETKEAAESIPEELLDQVIPVTATEGVVEKSVREVVNEHDEVLSGVDSVVDCLTKAA